jgi:hypothetical protein
MVARSKRETPKARLPAIGAGVMFHPNMRRRGTSDNICYVRLARRISLGLPISGSPRLAALIVGCVMELAVNLGRHVAMAGRPIDLTNEQAVKERDDILKIVYIMCKYQEANDLTIKLDKAVAEMVKFAKLHLIA